MTRAFSALTVLVVTAASLAFGLAGVAPAAAAPPTCFGAKATIVGTQGPDDLRGTPGRDVIVVMNGRDRVEGRGGADLICGGAGDDSLQGEDGKDRIAGDAGDDSISGGFDPDVLKGGPGEDNLDGGAQADHLSGGADGDGLSGGSGHDELSGNEGDDRLSGGEGKDRLRGEGGEDRLFGGEREDDLSGGEGDDELTGDDAVFDEELPAGSDDLLDGGQGQDLGIFFRSSRHPGGFDVDLSAGKARGQGTDELVDVESVHLDSDQADVVVGSSADNDVYTGGGNDVADGLGGDDVFFAAAGDDEYDGGTGSDTVSFERIGKRVSANLASGLAQGSQSGLDVLADMENLTGSERTDVLTGNDEANVIRGLSGEDALRGAAGDDVLRGGLNRAPVDLEGGTTKRSPDRLSGGPGDDLIDGGDVNLQEPWQLALIDEVDYSTAATPVVVDLSAGTATGEGTDTLVGIDDLVGSVHDDVLRGNDTSNEINGNAGNDVIDARAGDDEIEGSPGDDAVDAGDGVDLMDYGRAHNGVTVDLAAGISTGQGNDTVVGAEDIVGSLFGDQLAGDAGDNVIDSAFGDDVVHAGAGADRLFGDTGDDDLYGEEGADVLDGEVGDDLQDGGADADVLWSTPGNDDHVGGTGADWLDLSREPVGAEVDLEAGTVSASGNGTVAEVENLLGTLFDDRLLGDEADNVINARGGLDEVDGRGGSDRLFGGADRYRDFVSGGTGTDTVDYSSAYRRIIADLQNGFSEGMGADVLIALENVIGSRFGDDLRGDEGVNNINGGAGDDEIDLRDGNDVGDGAAGTDSVDGGAGTDSCTAEFLVACE